MKKVLKVMGIILGVIILVIAGLFVKNMIDANKPYLSDNYYEAFKSNSPLEQKYAGKGCYAVSKIEIKSNNKNISKISIWYPSELESSDKVWPLILNVNASNNQSAQYPSVLRASGLLGLHCSWQ